MPFEEPKSQNQPPQPDERDKPGDSGFDRNEEYDRLRHIVGAMFDKNESGSERVKELKKRIGDLIQFIERPTDEVLADLDACADIEDRSKFIEAVFPIMQPIIEAKLADPAAFEVIARKEFMRQSDFTEINQLLAYGIHKDTMHLHVQPNKATIFKDKLRFIKDGMVEIANIVRDNEEIKYVTGTSFLVADNLVF